MFRFKDFDVCNQIFALALPADSNNMLRIFWSEDKALCQYLCIVHISLGELVMDIRHNKFLVWQITALDFSNAQPQTFWSDWQILT